MPFYLNFDIPGLCISIMLSAISACVIYLLILYRGRINRIAKHQSKCESSNNLDNCKSTTTQPNESGSLPPASIIIYANDEASSLAHLLPQILEQDYPAPFEVIVVNDGASEATKDVVTEFESIYPNLYLTFTPDNSRSLSRKKLALTLGIKAARYDIAVFTNANSRIHSNKWLSLITRNFNEDTDIVIGHATPDISSDTNIGKRFRAFDRVADSIPYLSAAIGNAPYRGFSYNLAYRRSCFFENKGFSRSLNLHYGDDDIFINEICTKNNTAVELSKQSFVECKFHHPAKTHSELKRRYSYTARYLRKKSQLFWGSCSLAFWIWLILSITVIATTLPNLFPSAIIAFLALSLWIPIIISWRKALSALKSRKLLFTIPIFILMRPFYNAIFKIKNKRNMRRNHTWIK